MQCMDHDRWSEVGGETAIKDNLGAAALDQMVRAHTGCVVMAVHTSQDSWETLWSWISRSWETGGLWDMEMASHSNMILRFLHGWWRGVPTFWARELRKWHWYVARRGAQFWMCGVWGAWHQLKTSRRHEPKPGERDEAKSWEGIKSGNRSKKRTRMKDL